MVAYSTCNREVGIISHLGQPHVSHLKQPHIPAGTLIFMLLNYESTNPELFENPEQFNPQRWLELSSEQKRTYNKVLMPFGAGARLCPGRLLSFIEMKSALITVLKQYTFSHHNGENTTEDSFEFTLVPKGLRVNIQRR